MFSLCLPLGHSMLTWKQAHDKIFHLSHILRPRQKKNVFGNTLGKYKTTDMARINNSLYMCPE